MGKYLETEFLGTGDHGLKTLVGAEFESDEKTVAAFENARKAAEAAGVNIKNAPFLLDLREENGDIIDTIGISAEMYTRITGEPVLSPEEYREIDTKWWQAAKGMCVAFPSPKLGRR